jgi:polysaccharide export outer membrane protein
MRNVVVTVLALAVIGQAAAIAQSGSAQSTSAQPGTATAQQTTKQAAPPATQAKPGTKPTTKPGAKPATPAVVPAVAVPDPGFIIGPEDVLGVLFWSDKEMSGDVTVRPDGMVTLPLIRDIKAAGLTPTQLADRIQEAVREYITDASVTVVVRQMNSRKVFITGEVTKPGSYPLSSGSMTVMQLIALSGGLTEWAQPKSISILRVENGKTKTFPFNYNDVAKGKKAEQNILLKPGDTIVIPER